MRLFTFHASRPLILPYTIKSASIRISNRTVTPGFPSLPQMPTPLLFLYMLGDDRTLPPPPSINLIRVSRLRVRP